MRNTKSIFAVVCFTLAANANAETATGSASAEVLQDIALTETQQVNFGKIVTGVTGSCWMSPTGSVSGSSSVCIDSAGTAGVFSVTGAADQSVHIQVTDSQEIDGVRFSPRVDGNQNQFKTDTLSAAGTLDVTVYGPLYVNNATAGSASVGYGITVNYQ